MAGISCWVFETALGWVGIADSAAGICRITLPQPTADLARAALGKPGTNRLTNNLAATCQRLRDYYTGNPVIFPEPIDTSRATPFQRGVWELTHRIPYGHTRSYDWLARQLGRPGAARAVGQALNRNPLPIIVPCHRVITSDGRPGGFRGGTSLKQRLLDMEATVISRWPASPPAAFPGSSA